MTKMIEEESNQYEIDGYTLKEIGQKLGISASRVRQIEQLALYKLRNPRYSGELKAYLQL